MCVWENGYLLAQGSQYSMCGCDPWWKAHLQFGMLIFQSTTPHLHRGQSVHVAVTSWKGDECILGWTMWCGIIDVFLCSSGTSFTGGGYYYLLCQWKLFFRESIIHGNRVLVVGYIIMLKDWRVIIIFIAKSTRREATAIQLSSFHQSPRLHDIGDMDILFILDS